MGPDSSEPIVILGAGIAGLSVAKGLRGAGSDQRILLLGGEQGLPYKRTHLSKNLYRPLVQGEFSMISPEELESLGIEYRSPVWASEIDLKNALLKTNEGDYPYSTLVLALGSTPLVTPGYYFEEDFLNLQKLLFGSPRKVRILGSGVLGAELAEQLSRQGHRVIMNCRGVSPMARELPDPIGLRLVQLLADHGIEISFGSSFPIPDSESVNLSALGVRPHIQIAQDSGIDVGVGIRVNAFLETSVPGIYAVGDCAELPDRTVSHLWHQAEEQGLYAARRIWGEKDPFRPRVFRTKAEFFGQKVFSAGIIRQTPDIDKVDTFETWTEGSLDFWARYREKKLVGLSFIGDWSKEFGKLALQGVREGWDPVTTKKSL